MLGSIIPTPSGAVFAFPQISGLHILIIASVLILAFLGCIVQLRHWEAVAEGNKYYTDLAKELQNFSIEGDQQFANCRLIYRHEEAPMGVSTSSTGCTEGMIVQIKTSPAKKKVAFDDVSD